MALQQTDFLTWMADGTLKQRNPFSGTEVWTVAGRGKRPHENLEADQEQTIELHDPEDYCPFCRANYHKVPPEKARLIQTEQGYKTLLYRQANQLNDTTALFRRIPNLFEIITYDYWEKNYGFKLSEDMLERQSTYIATEEGREHIRSVIDRKLARSGLSEEEINEIPFEEKRDMSRCFFAGSHEVIIGGRHYDPDAKKPTDRASSGDLTPEEHFQYFKFTTDALLDIYLNNRYIRYVTVFQNWLKESGASFDHLHKQLVGSDGRSAACEREYGLVRAFPNAYNAYGTNYAGYQNLIFAENPYAIAYADFGHRFPTLAIYSKSSANQPWNHTQEEIQGVSELVHACHAAMGSDIPCNEEWYYRPPDVDVAMPWHILIKWRISTPAGFEAVTKIYVNTISPWELRDQVVSRLYDLRAEGKIAEMRIADECDCSPNSLKYNPRLQTRSSVAPPDFLPQAQRSSMSL